MKNIQLLVWMILFCCLPAHAQEIDANTHEDTLITSPNLTLHDVLEKTVQHSPEQARIRAQEFQVTAKQKMANSFLPQAPSVSVYHQNDTLGNGRNERDWQAELELPVWLPKQKNARAEVANQSALQLNADTESVRALVAGALREALWEIALNRNEVSLFQEKVNNAQRLEADTLKKFQAGELAKTDLMLAQQETLIAQKNLIRANAELMHAHYRYIVLTGQKEIPVQFEETRSSLEGYEASPVWKAAEAKITLAQSERTLSQIEKRENPQVILNARSAQGAFDNAYNQSVGVKIRIPLDSAVRSAPVIATSEQQLGIAISERDKLRLALETQLHEAEHNLMISQQELDIAKQQYEIAKHSETLAQKAYALGELDLVSLIRIQSQTFEAERSYSRRQLQIKWDIARYNQAVGVLP